MIDLGNFWLRFKPHYHQWLWKQSHTILALTDGSETRFIAERALAMRPKIENNNEPQQWCVHPGIMNIQRNGSWLTRTKPKRYQHLDCRIKKISNHKVVNEKNERNLWFKRAMKNG